MNKLALYITALVLMLCIAAPAVAYACNTPTPTPTPTPTATPHPTPTPTPRPTPHPTPTPRTSFYAPAAKISAGCEDPMRRVTLINKRSTGRVTFHVTWHPTLSSVKTKNYTVAAGRNYRTPYFHSQGGTSVIVSARGKLLAISVSRRDPWQGKCPA